MANARMIGTGQIGETFARIRPASAALLTPTIPIPVRASKRSAVSWQLDALLAEVRTSSACIAR